MADDQQTRRVVVPDASAGERLDRTLAAALEGLSRSRIQALIGEGQVSMSGRTLSDGSMRVKPGEVIDVAIPAPAPAVPAAEAISLAIVHEDRDLIVIDKPAGMVVHPAAGHASGTLVNALIAHCGAELSGIGGVKRPGIVHRLDKDTSGLLVVAKSDPAHQGLAEQFASHGRDGRLERMYLAFVWGQLERDAGTIDAAVGRSVSNRLKMAVLKRGGRNAVTHYRVIDRYASRAGKKDEVVVSLLSLQLETGRTHQIRLHLAHVGHPLLGDTVYGAGFQASANRLEPQSRTALAALGRQALHAARLAFEHPVTGKKLKFESGLPADLQQLRQALGDDFARVRSR